MENKENILTELKEISPLLIGLQEKETLAIPKFYFENLSTTIINAIQKGKEARYYFTPNMPYSLPLNYFDTLANNILLKIHKQQNESVEDELKAIAPLLNTISKKSVFKVPDAYFETIKNAPTKGKIVRMNIWKKYAAYAIAASFFAIIAVGIFYLNIQNKKPAATAAVSQQVKNLSEDEIIQYITADVADDNINATDFLKNPMENDLSKSVKQMSDKEIKQYLEELGDKEGI